MTLTASIIRRRYRELLRRSMVPNSASTTRAAQRLSSQATAAGMSSLDLALLHEQLLAKELPPGATSRQRRILTTAAGALFTSVLDVPNSSNTTAGIAPQLHELLSRLSRRTIELSAVNNDLTKRVEELKQTEIALRRSEQQESKVRLESERLQGQLRRLSRQLINAQEEERRNISRELHDVIGQTLAGINIRLATLKQEAKLNTAGLDRQIAQAQRLVLRSVNIVHRFARQLRPAALDDLGLLPALQAQVRTIFRRSNVKISLAVCAEEKRLNTMQRTVLFRVAQEALTNVARHARARSVDLHVTRIETSIRMVIRDNGRSFAVKRILASPSGKHLGLLGMRERIQMLDGCFDVQSEPGVGTTITASIPMHDKTSASKKRALQQDLS